MKRGIYVEELRKIVAPLLEWFSQNKRDLPWRETTDSYKIWISEIMLQQTRVEAVKEYYKRFLKTLPTIKDLANVEEDKLLKLWEGLGYYSRARNLKKCAEVVLKGGNTDLPRNYDELLALPGIGPYAAGSIGSIAYGLKTPAIDGNVLRVMTRLHEDERNILNVKVRMDYYSKIEKIMPENTRDFTESLMELGALVCLPNGAPLCPKCPLQHFCEAFNNETILKYPVKDKPKARKIEEKTILILEYEKEFAILKRNDKGLLASLYEFPNIDKEKSEVEIKEMFENIGAEFICLGTSKHVFSHIEWHMIGYYIKLKEKPNIEYTWVNKEEMKSTYSIPNAFSKYRDIVLNGKI